MTSGRWQTNIIMTMVVFFTVVIGLLMAQLDFVSLNLLPTETAVLAESDPDPTETTLPVVPIPTSTQTPAGGGNESNPSGKVTNTPIPDGDMPCMTPPTHWIEYEVQASDTILSLSIAFETTQEEMIQFNCLTARSLSVGTIILVPGIEPTPKVCDDPPASWRLYTVQRGDTMFSLARFRGITVLEVLNANCLSSPSIDAGEQIYLPTTIVITLTPTSSATATSEPMLTSTANPRPTETPPVIPTGTFTPEPLPSLTPTGTLTATPSATNTPTATITPSPTDTATETAVPTSTSTLSPSSTPTETPTQTPTSTPTEMPVTIGTETPTSTPTSPATNTPTATSTIIPGG